MRRAGHVDADEDKSTRHRLVKSKASDFEGDCARRLAAPHVLESLWSQASQPLCVLFVSRFPFATFNWHALRPTSLPSSFFLFCHSPDTKCLQTFAVTFCVAVFFLRNFLYFWWCFEVSFFVFSCFFASFRESVRLRDAARRMRPKGEPRREGERY
jgi:hypothetical protein